LQEPTLALFGLDDSDPSFYETLESWQSWSPILRALVAAGLGYLVFLVVGDAGVGSVAGGVFGVIAMSPIGDGCEDAVLRLVVPKLFRCREFKAARRTYAEHVRELHAAERRRKAEHWLALSGHGFERELAAVFERAGFEVSLTPGSRDGGVDIFLRHAGRLVAVQCKHTKDPVGPSVARDLFGAVAHCGADEGILATTGAVTSGVEEFFRGKPLRVMGLSEIVALHERTLGGVGAPTRAPVDA
jgi:hypothetical protein